MKVTDEMIDAFGKAVWAHPWTDAGQTELSRSEVQDALQAVLDLITIDPGHQVYYRSLTSDGAVWSESSAQSDFPHTSPNSGPLIYQKIEIDTMSSGWQEWTP